MATPQSLGSAPAARTAGIPAITLVDRAVEPSRADIDGLAATLLDLGSAYESALRTVLSMQRLLERVRRSRELSPEAALLIQEMCRQCQGLMDGGSALDDTLRAAGRRLETLRP
jgi:hypothetical protein